MPLEFVKIVDFGCRFSKLLGTKELNACMIFGYKYQAICSFEGIHILRAIASKSIWEIWESYYLSVLVRIQMGVLRFSASRAFFSIL